MPTGTPQPALKGRECKHVVYVPAQDGSMNDLLFVKEYEHYEDGTTVPRTRMIKNYKRKFWVTLPNFQKHRDKKEWEDISRLREFPSTQIALVQNIARALGRTPSKNSSLRMMARSPYLYGCDVTTPVLAKRHYMDTWPDCVSVNKVAVLDAETDMVEGHEEIIMLALTCREKAKLVVVKKFLEGVYDPTAKIHAAFEKYLGEYKRERNIQLEIEYVDNAGDCAFRILQTAHEWQPDILAIWNMNFDIPKMMRVLEKYGYDLADVFSDPSVPRPFRYFRYIEGAAQKVTSSGKTMALHPAEQWHVAECPASFYILDAMCVYLKLRIAKGKEPSYSLDYVLEKHLGIRKLKFEEANHVKGPKWHTFMQKNYPIEYCIYNLFDCISTELLDEKTTDLRQLISSQCGHSEYHRFPSQPRRTCDDLHFFCLERGRVAATTSDKMSDDLDQHVVGINDWIVTLPSYLVHDNGIKCIEELPDVATQLRAHVADLDVEGTYPNEEVLMNISKETTAKELSRIQGIDETTQRMIGINLSGGYVNAVEICCALYQAPTMDTLLASFREDKMPGSRARPEMMKALVAEEAIAAEGVDEMREEYNVTHDTTDHVAEDVAAIEAEMDLSEVA